MILHKVLNRSTEGSFEDQLGSDITLAETQIEEAREAVKKLHRELDKLKGEVKTHEVRNRVACRSTMSYCLE